MSGRCLLCFECKSILLGHLSRHLLVDRVTFSASLIAGLRESHSAMSSFSPATVEKALEHVAVLLSWDAETGNVATNRFIYGQPMTEAQIRGLKQWPESRSAEKQERSEPRAGRTVDTALSSTRQATVTTTLRGYRSL